MLSYFFSVLYSAEVFPTDDGIIKSTVKKYFKKIVQALSLLIKDFFGIEITKKIIRCFCFQDMV